MSTNQFRIRHGQSEFSPFVGFIPAGPINVFQLRSQDVGAPSFHAGHRSRAGIKYAAAQGPRIPAPKVNVLPEKSGYSLEVTMSGDVVYLQKHGTLHRADRLVAK